MQHLGSVVAWGLGWGGRKGVKWSWFFCREMLCVGGWMLPARTLMLPVESRGWGSVFTFLCLFPPIFSDGFYILSYLVWGGGAIKIPL